MNLLFLGDIVGKQGREIIRDLLPFIKEKYNIDFVVCNAENSAHGKGITIKIYNELKALGIGVITMGNHTYSKSDILEHIDEMNDIVFPVNHIKTDSHLYKVINVLGTNICFVNLLGNAFLGDFTTDLYEGMNRIIELTKNLNIDFYFVDLHGESTAEKRLFVEYYKDKKVGVVVGTHTHVQTADERMINDTAFITDVGMCGAYDSIIGRSIEESIKSNILKEKTRYEVADNKAVLCGCVINVDKKKVRSIQRIQIRPY